MGELSAKIFTTFQVIGKFSKKRNLSHVEESLCTHFYATAFEYFNFFGCVMSTWDLLFEPIPLIQFSSPIVLLLEYIYNSQVMEAT